jgi:hypothetical protein
MYTFILTTYDKDGIEQAFAWDFSPIDREPGFETIRQDKPRATGAGSIRPFCIKEVWSITIGAGTFLSEDHRKNFLRLITAKKIVWKRHLHSKQVETEFELETDARLMFEYLQDKRSLKRKTFTIVEKEPHYYDTMDEFYENYLVLIESNSLW